MRSQKTVGGVTTKYEYLGGKLVYENRGGMDIYYKYNSMGNLSGITYYIGTTEYTYYVVCDSRGDVEAIYNGSGTLVAQYRYDTWGNILSITDANGAAITDQNNVGNVNPIRYRGYYYDTEIGMYYLQSRYYDPTTCRMLNADSQLNPGTGLAGMNMFAYCNNNPVNASDPSGHYLDPITGLLMMSPFSLQDCFAPPKKETNFMTAGGSGNATAPAAAKATSKGSSTVSKITAVASAIGDVGIGAWAAKASRPMWSCSNCIWTYEPNGFASVCKTAGEYGGPLAIIMLTIDVGSDCYQYEGVDILKAISYDSIGFGVGFGAGALVAFACSNPVTGAVVVAVVAGVGISLITNEVIYNIKNENLKKRT